MIKNKKAKTVLDALKLIFSESGLPENLVVVRIYLTYMRI